jgi:hypothetical protein
MPELTLKAIEHLLDVKFKQELKPTKTDIANIRTGMASWLPVRSCVLPNAAR